MNELRRQREVVHVPDDQQVHIAPSVRGTTSHRAVQACEHDFFRERRERDFQHVSNAESLANERLDFMEDRRLRGRPEVALTTLARRFDQARGNQPLDFALHRAFAGAGLPNELIEKHAALRLSEQHGQHALASSPEQGVTDGCRGLGTHFGSDHTQYGSEFATGMLSPR